MVKLYGIPKAAWKLLRENVSAGPALILWRIALIAGATYGVVILWYSTGGGGLAAVVIGFAITSVLSYALRDDILAVWRDLWNARWAEVKV